MKKILVIITSFICFAAQGQTIIENSNIDSGGAVSTNGTISMLYSLGETVVQEKKVGNIIISEGFINSNFPKGIISGLKDYKKLDGIKILQDRTSNLINVIFAITGTYSVTAFDALGRKMSKQTANQTNQLSLNVKNYNQGVYILLIQDMQKKQFETFKIIIN